MLFVEPSEFVEILFFYNQAFILKTLYKVKGYELRGLYRGEIVVSRVSLVNLRGFLEMDWL
jgi:hypothetical protein